MGSFCILSSLLSRPYRSHKDEIGEEIFDMLLSFSDFLTFKQMFLDYKAVSGQSLHCGTVVHEFLRPSTLPCSHPHIFVT